MTASAATNHPLAPDICALHARMPARKDVHETGHENTKSHPCVAPTYCQTKPIVGRHLCTFLSQGRRINAVILEQDDLLPSSSFTTLCFLLLQRCLGSSHANLQPSAPLIGVSIKNCPKICFSSALNVFAIKSRCGELKEQFSGLNKIT